MSNLPLPDPLDVIPKFYLQPSQLPVYWKMLGRPFAEAIEIYQYRDRVCLKPEQFELLRLYAAYFINAPRWTGGSRRRRQKIRFLRWQARHINAPQDLEIWRAECRKLGLKVF